MTLLTIAIPTFNRADSLKRTLDSVKAGLAGIANWGEGIEVIISDNASNDDTKKVCSVYEKFKYYQQEQNIGYDKNVLFLFKKSAGHFLLLISDDDIFEPQGLVDLFSMIRMHPDVDVFFCNWYAAKNAGKKTSLLHPLINRFAPSFQYGKIRNETPFYFLSSFALRKKIFNMDVLMTDTYAIQMEMALSSLSCESKCMVSESFLIGRIESQQELIGGNSDSSREWKIHLGFTRVRRRYQKKFQISMSPVAEISSAITVWSYFRNTNKPIIKRFSILFVALYSGLRYSKPIQIIRLPGFLWQRFAGMKN